jgi:ABC-2 type transport system permease protein
MDLMRKIAAIAWKDALVRFASRSEILFFLVLPIVFTVILGGGLVGGGQGDNRLPVLVVDADHSGLSAELIQALDGSSVARVVAVSAEDGAAQFDQRAASVLLTIPAGYQATLEAGQSQPLEVRSAPNDLNAAAVVRAIEAAASQVSRPVGVALTAVAEAERRQPFASEAERAAYLSESLALARKLLAEAPERLAVTRSAAAEAAGVDMPVQGSAGQLITWVFVPLLGTSALFAFERSQGTLRRLLTTPTSKATYLLGTLGGQLALAMLQMLLLVIFGITVMHLEWGRSPLALALLLLAFGLASVALGTTLGTFVKTEGQANGLSIVLGMVMALLGGCWYPLEMFPSAARVVAKLLPTSWAMEGVTGLMSRGVGLAGVLPAVGVLAGFAVVFFAVGVWRFKYE